MGKLETHLALKGRFTLGQQAELLVSQPDPTKRPSLILVCLTCGCALGLADNKRVHLSCPECGYDASPVEVNLFLKSAARAILDALPQRGLRWALVRLFAR